MSDRSNIDSFICYLEELRVRDDVHYAKEWNGYVETCLLALQLPTRDNSALSSEKSTPEEEYNAAVSRLYVLRKTEFQQQVAEFLGKPNTFDEISYALATEGILECREGAKAVIAVLKKEAGV